MDEVKESNPHEYRHRRSQENRLLPLRPPPAFLLFLRQLMEGLLLSRFHRHHDKHQEGQDFSIHRIIQDLLRHRFHNREQQAGQEYHRKAEKPQSLVPGRIRDGAFSLPDAFQLQRVMRRPRARKRKLNSSIVPPAASAGIRYI